MNILITVYFNSQSGGLHNNILSTSKFLIRKGHKVTVLCKPGIFSTQLATHGIDVITTSFDNIENSVKKLVDSNKNFDIIHAHPFLSREVAIEYHIITKVPLFITYHGMYTDNISRNLNYAERIITVSDSHSDYLKGYNEDWNEKFITIPNGVNLNIFKPARGLGAFYRLKLKEKQNKEKFTIVLVTRIDKDKTFILNLFLEALKKIFQKYSSSINWVVVGDGELLNDTKQKVNKIVNGQENLVEFVGWKSEEELVKYYQLSDLVIGPGRCALEAMACSKPVIALGSKSYIGLITHDNWKKGVYTNFGGLGMREDDYITDTIFKDIEAVFNNNESAEDLGKLGEKIIKYNFNEDSINENILKQYELALMN